MGKGLGVYMFYCPLSMFCPVFSEESSTFCVYMLYRNSSTPDTTVGGMKGNSRRRIRKGNIYISIKSVMMNKTSPHVN
jgi:hypothetical protein